jgi:hypothetical protein
MGVLDPASVVSGWHIRGVAVATLAEPKHPGMCKNPGVRVV